MPHNQEMLEELRLLKAFSKVTDPVKRREIVELAERSSSVEEHKPAHRELVSADVPGLSQ
jgi:hypothetical protein